MTIIFLVLMLIYIAYPKGYSEADGVIKIPPYMVHLI